MLKWIEKLVFEVFSRPSVYLIPLLKSTFLNCSSKTQLVLGSGCGSVGRAVASNTRGPQFESSHQQFYLYWQCIEKTKRGHEWPNFLKKLKKKIRPL